MTNEVKTVPETVLDCKTRGNALFGARDFVGAIRAYTEGIERWVPTADVKLNRLVYDLYANRSKAYYELVVAPKDGRPELAHLVYSDVTKVPFQKMTVKERAYYARVLALVHCYNEAAKQTGDMVNLAPGDARDVGQPRGWPSWQAMHDHMVNKAKAFLGASKKHAEKNHDDPLQMAFANVLETSDYQYMPTFDVAHTSGSGGKTEELLNAELKQHNPKVQVRAAGKGRGLGLFATDTIQRGDVIFDEEAFVFAPLQEDRCFRCGTAMVVAVVCPTCSFERYCGADCRDKAAKEYHAALCGIDYAKLRAGIRTSGLTSQSVNLVFVLRLLGRLLVERKQQQQQQGDTFWNSRDPFVRHWTSAIQQPPEVPTTRFFAMTRRHYMHMVQLLASAKPEPSIRCDIVRDFDLEIFDAMVTMAGHCGVVALPEQTGACLYKLASLINHGCAPNVGLVTAVEEKPEQTMFNNRQRVVAMQDIAAGEELVTCYVFSPDHVVRQTHLGRMYGFQCECEVCVAQAKHPLDRNCKCALCMAMLSGMRDAGESKSTTLPSGPYSEAEPVTNLAVGQRVDVLVMTDKDVPLGWQAATVAVAQHDKLVLHLPAAEGGEKKDQTVELNPKLSTNYLRRLAPAGTYTTPGGRLTEHMERMCQRAREGT